MRNAHEKEVRARTNPSPYRYDEDLLSPLARYLTATTSPRWETYASPAYCLKTMPIPRGEGLYLSQSQENRESPSRRTSWSILWWAVTPWRKTACETVFTITDSRAGSVASTINGANSRPGEAAGPNHPSNAAARMSAAGPACRGTGAVDPGVDERTSTTVASERTRTPVCSKPTSTRDSPSGPITHPVGGTPWGRWRPVPQVPQSHVQHKTRAVTLGNPDSPSVQSTLLLQPGPQYPQVSLVGLRSSSVTPCAVTSSGICPVVMSDAAVRLIAGLVIMP